VSHFYETADMYLIEDKSLKEVYKERYLTPYT